MNVAILKGQEQLTRQIERSLQLHQIKGDLVDKINNRLLLQYDFLIVHSEQKPKIPERVIEQIVLQQEVVVIYVHHQSNLSSFYQLAYDPYFLPIPKTNVVETLPSMLTKIHQWQKEVKTLKEELRTTTIALLEIKSTSKAKRLLINTGLSEEEAHNWIQKAAMDKRLKKSDIVNLIIQQKIDISSKY